MDWTIAAVVLSALTVILAVAGIIWRAGRNLVTRADLGELKAENEKAHAAIAESVRTVARDVQVMSRDIAFLAGRQAERDASAHTTTSPVGPPATGSTPRGRGVVGGAT